MLANEFRAGKTRRKLIHRIHKLIKEEAQEPRATRQVPPAAPAASGEGSRRSLTTWLDGWQPGSGHLLSVAALPPGLARVARLLTNASALQHAPHPDNTNRQRVG